MAEARKKAHMLIYEMSKAHMTQGMLAAITGISVKAMSNKICGRTEFRRNEIEAICKALKISDPRPVFFPELVPRRKEKGKEDEPKK